MAKEAEEKKTRRKTWEAVEQKDAMYIKMEMPGVSKEDVRVYLDGIHLVIKGKTKPDPELEGDKKLTPKIYFAKICVIAMLKTSKTREMTAEMMNGVLRVKIPRIVQAEMGVLKVKIPSIEEMEVEDIVNIKVD